MASISATAPLRSPNFRWYFASRSVNLVGNMMAPVALAFAVLDTSGSPLALGVVLAARTIPMIVLLLVGGVLGDRMGRHRVIAWSNTVSGASQAVTAALLISGHARLWELIVLAAINGTAAAAGLPASNGLMPQLVPREQLQQANVLTSLTRAVVAVIGPGAAAVIVTTAGPGWALALDAVTWFAAAALLRPVQVAEPAFTGRRPLTRDLAEGWGLFRATTWLWVGVAAFAVLNALYEGGFITLGPALAKETDLGPRGWGLLLSMQGLGVLVATLALLRWRLERPLVSAMIGFALFGMPMVMLGATSALGPLLAVGFASGLGVQVCSLGWSLALQENLPGHMLSRASSYDSLGSYAAVPLGQILLGHLGASYGVAHVVMICGLISVVVALLPLTVPAFRGIRRPALEPATAPTSAQAS